MGRLYGIRNTKQVTFFSHLRRTKRKNKISLNLPFPHSFEGKMVGRFLLLPLRKTIIGKTTYLSMDQQTNGNIVIYQSEDGKTHLEVKYEQESLWLSQQQICDLYQTSRTNIVEHIKHIYEDGELTEDSTCRKFRQVRQEGSREVTREMAYYNLDMILSVGYRVRSSVASRFRQWATERLTEYLYKGFTMDDERLKQLGGGGYWKAHSLTHHATLSYCHSGQRPGIS